jgi:hypothetical protein
MAGGMHMYGAVTGKQASGRVRPHDDSSATTTGRPCFICHLHTAVGLIAYSASPNTIVKAPLAFMRAFLLVGLGDSSMWYRYSDTITSTMAITVAELHLTLLLGISADVKAHVSPALET